MDKKLVITIVVAVLLALAVVWGFSLFSGPAQVTGNVVASSPVSSMVGGC
jgi:hypothetical protein